MHAKKGTDYSNLVAKCSILNDPIIIVHKNKIQIPTLHMIRFVYCSNKLLRVRYNLSKCYPSVLCFGKQRKEYLERKNTNVSSR